MNCWEEDSLGQAKQEELDTVECGYPQNVWHVGEPTRHGDVSTVAKCVSGVEEEDSRPEQSLKNQALQNGSPRLLWRLRRRSASGNDANPNTTPREEDGKIPDEREDPLAVLGQQIGSTGRHENVPLEFS